MPTSRFVKRHFHGPRPLEEWDGKYGCSEPRRAAFITRREMLGGKTHHIRGGAHSSTDVFCFCVRKLTPHRLAVELLLWFRRGQLRRKHSPADFSTKTAAWRSTRYEYSTGAPSAQRGSDGAGCRRRSTRGTSACPGCTGAELLKSVTRTLINSLLEATDTLHDDTSLFSSLGIMSDASADT